MHPEQAPLHGECEHAAGLVQGLSPVILSYMEDIIHKVLRTDFSNNFARTLSPVSSWTPGLASPLRSWKTPNSGLASISISDAQFVLSFVTRPPMGLHHFSLYLSF